MKAPPQDLPGPEEEPSWHLPFPEASSPGAGRAWRGGFKVSLLGALCYTIGTKNAPPQAEGNSPGRGRAGRDGFMLSWR